MFRRHSLRCCSWNGSQDSANGPNGENNPPKSTYGHQAVAGLESWPEAKDLTSSFICSKMYDLVSGEAAEGRTRLALHCRHRGRMSFEAGPAGKSKDS